MTTDHSPQDNDFELPIDGFQGTPDEIERQWYEKVYRGRGDSMPQLTWRAVLMGSLLGSLLSLTNLYIGLKAGWAFGVAITACILSYTIWTTFYRLGLVRTPMTILENNCMQSTASAAGYSTGGTLISAYAAYLMLPGTEPISIPFMLVWVFFLAVLGVTVAIPMKRQMINIEQLRFPSGIAAAETLRALHSEGAKAARAAWALAIAGVAAALNQFWMQGFALIDKAFKLDKVFESVALSTWVTKLNELTFTKEWRARTVFFEWDPIFIAAGALTGLRASASMMLGGTLCWAVFVPYFQAKGIVPTEGYSAIVKWTLWGGVSCMVTSSLLSFAMQWQSVARAFGNLSGIFSKQKRVKSEIEALEAPMSWFVAGQVVSFIALAILGVYAFNMSWWQTAIAVLLTVFLALVSCRVTGETDTTPMGPLGKVTQLIFGAISPRNMIVNLMSANVTAAGAASSADLLTDLKSGYLLGANPRKQFIAQFAGIFSGTLATVVGFRLLVPNATVLGGDQLPAPAAQAWKAVAEVLSQGVSQLGPVKLWSIAIGGLVGILLTLLATWFPKHAHWIPSPAGLGLAWTFQWYTSLLFFLGAVISYSFEKSAPEESKEFTYPVASGIVAGGSLMSVVLIFVENGPQLYRQLFVK